MSITVSGGSGYSIAGNLIGTGAFTIACYAKDSGGTGGFQTFIGVDDAGANYSFFGLDNTRQFRPDYRGNGLSSGLTPTSGSWYYYALTYDDAGAGIAYHGAYGGGSLTTTSGTLVDAAGTTTRIGVDGYSSFLNGEIAYVRIWSAVLSSSELESERLSPTVVRSSNLTAAYHFDTASTTDNSGNGNTLTAIGTPGSGTSPSLTAATKSRPLFRRPSGLLLRR